MPISEKTLVGIDIPGSGDIQYVQGLRVEACQRVIRVYSKPWFSYDILDSSIIAGRDRNEIKEGIIDKIRTFWENNDNEELVKKLVYTVVKDETKKIISPELTFFCKVLSGDIEKQESVDNVKKIQAVIDKELIEQLSLEKRPCNINFS